MRRREFFKAAAVTAGAAAAHQALPAGQAIAAEPGENPQAALQGWGQSVDYRLRRNCGGGDGAAPGGLDRGGFLRKRGELLRCGSILW